MKILQVIESEGKLYVSYRCEDGYVQEILTEDNDRLNLIYSRFKFLLKLRAMLKRNPETEPADAPEKKHEHYLHPALPYRVGSTPVQHGGRSLGDGVCRPGSFSSSQSDLYL
jgi:hypothetical protein